MKDEDKKVEAYEDFLFGFLNFLRGAFFTAGPFLALLTLLLLKDWSGFSFSESSTNNKLTFLVALAAIWAPFWWAYYIKFLSKFPDAKDELYEIVKNSYFGGNWH